MEVRQTREEVLDSLVAIPGMGLPRADRLPAIAPMDLGGHAEAGVPELPARFVGEPYPTCVSAVDASGNEVGGIRMPDVAVPVATHAGFNPRHPPKAEATARSSSTSGPRFRSPRTPTPAPRPPIRASPSRSDTQAATSISPRCGRWRKRLAATRYLLPDDIELCVAIARDPPRRGGAARHVSAGGRVASRTGAGANHPRCDGSLAGIVLTFADKTLLVFIKM